MEEQIRLQLQDPALQGERRLLLQSLFDQYAAGNQAATPKDADIRTSGDRLILLLQEKYALEEDEEAEIAAKDAQIAAKDIEIASLYQVMKDIVPTQPSLSAEEVVAGPTRVVSYEESSDEEYSDDSDNSDHPLLHSIVAFGPEDANASATESFTHFTIKTMALDLHDDDVLVESIEQGHAEKAHTDLLFARAPTNKRCLAMAPFEAANQKEDQDKDANKEQDTTLMFEQDSILQYARYRVRGLCEEKENAMAQLQFAKQNRNEAKLAFQNNHTFETEQHFLRSIFSLKKTQETIQNCTTNLVTYRTLFETHRKDPQLLAETTYMRWERLLKTMQDKRDAATANTSDNDNDESSVNKRGFATIEEYILCVEVSFSSQEELQDIFEIWTPSDLEKIDCKNRGSTIIQILIAGQWHCSEWFFRSYCDDVQPGAHNVLSRQLAYENTSTKLQSRFEGYSWAVLKSMENKSKMYELQGLLENRQFSRPRTKPMVKQQLQSLLLHAPTPSDADSDVLSADMTRAGDDHDADDYDNASW